jgi:hypothetical protein|tara:strand:+ start:157 stop:783 length:627 start_codon:yes stop_codon:yes gene_type:complete
MEATPFACRVFSMMDDSGDGSVDFEEFCSMLTLFCSIGKGSFVAFAFSLYDTDGSQTLETDELRRMMEEVYGKMWESKKKVRDVLMQMDQDGDGSCDIGEFEEACKKHGYLMKPAFDMQNMLREKTLGHKMWKNISKRMTEHSGKDFKSMMNKLSGREELIANRIKENEATERLKEANEETDAMKERKKNSAELSALSAGGSLGHNAP